MGLFDLVGGDQGAWLVLAEDDGESEESGDLVALTGGEVEADDGLGTSGLVAGFGWDEYGVGTDGAELGGVGGGGRGGDAGVGRRSDRGGTAEGQGGSASVQREEVGGLAEVGSERGGAVPLELAKELGLSEFTDLLGIVENGGAGVVEDGDDDGGASGRGG